MCNLVFLSELHEFRLCLLVLLLLLLQRFCFHFFSLLFSLSRRRVKMPSPPSYESRWGCYLYESVSFYAFHLLIMIPRRNLDPEVCGRCCARSGSEVAIPFTHSSACRFSRVLIDSANCYSLTRASFSIRSVVNF